jgi:hypothetical protein
MQGAASMRRVRWPAKSSSVRAAANFSSLANLRRPHHAILADSLGNAAATMADVDKDRQKFITVFQTDVGTALKLDKARVGVTGIKAGSVRRNATPCFWQPRQH